MKIFPKTFINQLIAILFFLLLTLTPNPDLKFYVFCLLILLEIFYIFQILALKERWFFILFIFGIVSIMSYNSNLNYAVADRFNYHIYPVSIWDYFAFIVSFFFGVCCIKNDRKIFLLGCEYFSYIGIFLIVIDVIQSKSYHQHPPVFFNTNWSGSFIISVLLIAIQSSFSRLQQISLRANPQKTGFLKFALAIPCLILLYCSVFYFLLQTGSRSACISFILSFSLLLLFYLLKFKKKLGHLIFKSRLNKIIFFLLIPVATFIFYWLIKSFDFGNLNINFLTKISNLFDRSNQLRLDIYRCYFSVFKENILFGYGIGNVAQLCEDRLGLGVGDVNHGHNFILQIAANHGLLLAIPTIAILVAYLSLSLKYFVYSLREENQEKGLLLTFSLTVTSIIFASFFQLSIYHVPFLQIWIGLLAGGFTAIASHDIKMVSLNPKD